MTAAYAVQDLSLRNEVDLSWSNRLILCFFRRNTANQVRPLKASRELSSDSHSRTALSRFPGRVPEATCGACHQEIYKEAFNSAEEQYGEESRAHRVAWSAVENKYEKNDKGNWVQKKS